MNILVIFDTKFKTNRLKIENILRHFGLRKVQKHAYIGKLSKTDLNEIRNEFKDKINERESVLMIPLCENCYAKKESFGKGLKFREDLYRVF